MQELLSYAYAAIAIAVLALWWCWPRAQEQENYLPGLFARLREIAGVGYAVFNPVELEMTKDDVVIVMDAIEAYRDMYDEQTIASINRLCRLARHKGAQVIFTRWIRCKPETEEEKDATDIKGHWTNYVPPDQTEVFPELQDEAKTIAFVRFTNAFTSETVRSVVEENKPRRMILCGGWLEACIQSTCHACLENDIHVGVVRSASVGHSLLGVYASFAMQMVHATMYKLPPLLTERSRPEMTFFKALNVSWGWPARTSMQRGVKKAMKAN
jgi:nicotinamidase-related amidase